MSEWEDVGAEVVIDGVALEQTTSALHLLKPSASPKQHPAMSERRGLVLRGEEDRAKFRYGNIRLARERR